MIPLLPKLVKDITLMKIKKMSLRWRITLLNMVLLSICSITLAVFLNASAFKMADTIEAAPLTQATSIDDSEPIIEMFPMVPTVEITQARQAFKTNSFIAVLMIIVSGGALTYYLQAQALSPLSKLSKKMESLSISNLSEDIELPSSHDEIYMLTQSFNTMSQKLDKAFISQKHFSSSAAHELRTPLAVLKTKIEVFNMKNDRSQIEYQNLISVFDEQVARLITLVNHLLDLSNAELIDQKETFDLGQVLEDALNHLQPSITNKKLQVIKEQNHESIHGNKILLQNVFHNILENAILYNVEEGFIKISTHKIDDKIHITIENSGEVIETSQFKSVFVPFYRLNNQKLGSGLGLATVKNIVENHGGKIHFVETDGTTTKLELILS